MKTYPHRADGSSCPGCQGRQFCDDLFGYKMDSKKATEFVTKVRDAYNKKYQNNANVLPIRFGADYPTDGEFMDALQIAARENLPGLERVSTAAVCELGRDFTRMSKDKHAGTRKMTSALGQKGEERYYHNELGSYLAYIHDTSVLYPDAYVTVDGQQVCDWRFQPKGLVGGGCPSAMGIEMGKGYAYNNYNGTKLAAKIYMLVEREDLAIAAWDHFKSYLDENRNDYDSDDLADCLESIDGEIAEIKGLGR